MPVPVRLRGRPSGTYAASYGVAMTLRVWLLLLQVSDTLVRFASCQVCLPRVSDTGSGICSRQIQQRPQLPSFELQYRMPNEVSDTPRIRKTE